MKRIVGFLVLSSVWFFAGCSGDPSSEESSPSETRPNENFDSSNQAEEYESLNLTLGATVIVSKNYPVSYCPKKNGTSPIKWVSKRIEGNRCTFVSSNTLTVVGGRRNEPQELTVCRVNYRCPEDQYCGDWRVIGLTKNNALACTNTSGFGSQAPNDIGD